MSIQKATLRLDPSSEESQLQLSIADQTLVVEWGGVAVLTVQFSDSSSGHSLHVIGFDENLSAKLSGTVAFHGAVTPETIINIDASPLCTQWLGEFMRCIREGNAINTHPMTQDECAGFVGVSKALVSYWETGKRTPSLEQRQIVAQFIGVTYQRFMLEFYAFASDKMRELTEG